MSYIRALKIEQPKNVDLMDKYVRLDTGGSLMLTSVGYKEQSNTRTNLHVTLHQKTIKL